MSPEQEAVRIAAGQHGLVTFTQARQSGMSRHQILNRVQTGRWGRLRTGVFVVNGAPASWEQSALAAVLAAGPDAVASHMTAALAWGLPNVAHEVVFEVSTPRPRRARHRGVRVHRTVRFLHMEHTVRHGIPVTTVARTLVDLSGLLGVAQLGMATDDARREGNLRLDELAKCVAGLRPAPGRKPKRIQAVLGARVDGYDKTESGLEMRVLRAIVAAGLPEPVQQHWVRLGARHCRIDLAYPELELAIEVDGWKHHRERDAFDADRARDNDLDIAGWHRLHFTSAFSDKEIAETVTRKLATLGRLSRSDQHERPNGRRA